MATPRFAWGIDVGNRALKAIKLVRDGDQIRIDDFDVIEHEQILSQAGDNRESLLQSALATFSQRHAAKGGAVAIGVSGQSSFARFIKLPPVDPSKIPEIVKFEAVQQIPFPLEEVEWSYQLFQAPDSPEVEVGIFAMRRDLVNQAIKNFTDVGLEVNAVQTNPLAVYNGLYYDDRIEGTTMIVDVGSETSDLIIAEGENIWMRSIPIGGNNFTEALVKSFKLKFPKAEELKRNAATSKYGRQILQAMKPVFSDLVGEIQRSIGFYSSTHRESRIGKVLALGGTFRLPGLQKYLQQNLSLEVVRIDRLNAPSPADAKFATEFNENILSSVAAYGLALQALGQGKISSSLLPEKIKRERMWKEKTPWFAAAALLIVSGTVIPIGKWYQIKMAYGNQDNVRNQITLIQNNGKKLDTRWKNEVENSGTDDRNKITNDLTLLNDRDLALNLTMELAEAFPVVDQNEYKKPRQERNIVELTGFNMRYEADLTPMVAKNSTNPNAFQMSDDDFNALVDKVDVPGLGQQGGISGIGQSLPHFNPHGMGGTHAPIGANAAAAAAQPAGAGQRGFMVTIICRTSNQLNPTHLIAETVAQKLRSRNQKSSNPPRSFSIERVTIPSTKSMMLLYPTGTVTQSEPDMVFNPPGANGAGVPNPVRPINPIQQPFNRGPGGGPSVNPGFENRGGVPQFHNGPGTLAPGSQITAEYFPDPMRKGESTINDSLVTVLAAIVIDPPPVDPNKKP